MIRNLRYAFRQLRSNPSFTSVAVLSLALGIGATSGMFSVADALLLRPLPVPHAGEIVNVENTSPSDLHQPVSRLDFQDLRQQNRTLAALVAYTDMPVGYKHQADGLPMLKSAMLVSGTFFQDLEIQPALGRTFRADEDAAPGRNPVVILSYEFWASEFGASPSVLGKRLRLNGAEFTVIGVAPARFLGLNRFLRPHMYVPLAMAAALGSDTLWTDRGMRTLSVKGRLKAGISAQRAQADLSSIAASLSKLYPKTNKLISVRVNTELQARLSQSPDDATLVILLMTLASCVLIVACANVAGLLLSRARARTKEIALRLAIGANRGQIIWQLLLESSLISLLGGIGGLAVAYGCVQYFSQVETPTDLPMGVAIQMNPRMFGFTLAISLLSTLFFGLIPALRNTNVDLVPSLKAADADSKGKQSIWGRNGMVVAQVAVSLLLLAVSAVLFKGFAGVLLAGPGFQTDHLLMMSFNPSLVRYTPDQSRLFYKRLVEGVEMIPGVKHAALSYVVPMANNQHGESFVPEGYQLAPGQDSIAVAGNIVGPEYFEAMRIPIVSGRAFTADDKENTPRVAIINQVLADRYFKGQSPVGRRIRLGDSNAPWVQIVGVARNSKVYWIGETPVEFLYLPYQQKERADMTLFVRSQGDPSALAGAVRKVVSGIDANQPVFDVRTMDYFYSKRAVLTSHIVINAVGSLGLMGLFLAMVGLYGVIAFSVGRRKREIGLRMAIGAERTQVLRMILTQGLLLATVGVFLGVLLSVAASPLLRSLAILPPKPLDPLMLLGVSFAILLITLLAVFAPARRASLIDPMRALRDE